MKNISKKTFSIILTICIAAMTMLTGCGSLQQAPKSSAASKTESQSSNEEKSNDEEYLRVFKDYYKYFFEEQKMDLATKLTSGIYIEDDTNGDPSDERVLADTENVFDENLSKALKGNNLGAEVKIKSFKVRNIQEYNKKGMADIKKLIKKNFSYVKASDISDIKVLSYTCILEGDNKNTLRLSGKATVIKEKGEWKVCPCGYNNQDVDLLTFLEEKYSNQ